ncbi:hypothetical protein C5S31_09320 [ANME-1 cluster archaeon GoMg2]|nr:hypothetical protein [ANME-1 cluster archaeon GoMg2]
MQTHTYIQETILNLFGEIGLNLSKPLRTTLSALIVCLLENNKAHHFRKLKDSPKPKLAVLTRASV